MRLEEELDLIELDFVEKAYREPSAYRLKQVPKSQQSIQLVEYIVSNDGMALKYVSRKLITEKLCRIAVQENGLALQFVPNILISKELCDLAVSENGLALEFVPEKMRNFFLVNKAVQFYYYVNYYDVRDKRNETIKKAKVQGGELGECRKYPIAHVPTKLMNDKLLEEAIKYSPHSLRDVPRKLITKELILIAVSVEGTVIRYVPKNIISQTIIETAIINNPLALEFIPQSNITKDICLDCLKKTPLAIQFIPYMYLSYEMCNIAFESDIETFKYIPDEYKTIEMCLQIINSEMFQVTDGDKKDVCFSDIPKDIRNNISVLEAITERYLKGTSLLLEWNEHVAVKKNYGAEKVIEPLCEEAVIYLNKRREYEIKKRQERQEQSPVGIKMLEVATIDSKLMMSSLDTTSSSTLPVYYENETILHDFTIEEKDAKTFYYVSDIHLEHQIKSIIEDAIQQNKLILPEVTQFLHKKMQEMISGVKDNESTLLVGGDVANCKELTILFYKILREYWNGDVIFVLGNHELWDGHAEIDVTNDLKSVDQIVNEYREIVNDRECDSSERLWRTYILENDVYIIYKNKKFNGKRVISEIQLLNATNEDLTELCDKASTIILGGIGFSGFNPKYNAELGLYRSTVTTLNQDKELSKRFCRVYDKLKHCAGDKQVIVLTHTPIYDWTNEVCNPKWIYVNGHTHHNQLIIEDETIILSDNQIGYKPKKWKLNAFSVSGWYDPFDKYHDGIYKITPEEYRDFNMGRGIDSKGCNYQGILYMLKRDGLYMFLLETVNTLCLLCGGQRKKLERCDVNYYYNNMGMYGQIVCDAIKPYQQVMESLSKEVKRFGGTGKIHGCIVDISFFSHIYVNPFDGKMTAYWALDMSARLPFEDIQTLLEVKEPELLDQFIFEYKKQTLPVLEKYMMKNSRDNKLAIIPRWMFGTEIYAPSRIMRTVQYVWSQNVIRIWNEDIITEHQNQREISKKGKKLLIEKE